MRRSHPRRARFFTRAALGFVVGPVALALLAQILQAFRVHVHVGRFDDFVSPFWYFGWLLCAPLATTLAFRAARRVREDITAVVVRDDALILRDEAGDRSIPLSAIEGASAILTESAEVEILLANGSALHVVVFDFSAAAGLVTALGFGTAARSTVVPLGDAHDAVIAGCLGVLIGALVSFLSMCVVPSAPSAVVSLNVLGAVFVVASTVFARLFAPGRVVVGTDGLVLERAFRRRFFPLADIREVAETSAGYDLVLKNGAGSRNVTLVSNKEARACAVVARVREALRTHQPRGEDTASALIARGGRDIAAWREALRRLVTGAGYRAERVPPDALLRTVDSSTVSAEQRLGAAMAIGMGDDEDAKERLRVVVDGFANEKMRIAMAHAAEGAENEAAIEEAIAAEKKARRR
ncbi:Hypothetical protein A7982_08110 [Minicystis rosea]|nr:Hypothetical protein A7982_08110 [Minicystis rosea]